MNYDNFRDTYLERYSHFRTLEDPTAIVREVTLQVTEACNLRCTYCYQINKSPKVMSFDTAKACIDSLFTMSHSDDGVFINSTTQAIILDFIGGEPLLQVELMDKIVDYFVMKALEENPKWA